MGKNMKKRTTLRRAAATLGVLGALVMSSGIALMVTATPANAADCTPVAASIEVVHHDAVTHVVPHPAVADVPLQRFKWNPMASEDESDGPPPNSTPLNDAQNWQGNTTNYNGEDPLGVVFLSGNGNGNNNGSWFYWTVTPGHDAYDEIVIDTAAYDETINHPGVTCDTTVVSTPTTTVVSPPKANTPKAHTPKAHTPKAATVTTPTVVHAGLASVSAQDLRGEQGLALMVSGMVMLVAAGGLGLRLRGAASRI
jgi:hypothetical protein